MTGATRPVVVKLGGTTIAEERGVLEELAVLSRDRAVVVVHGGGQRLTQWLDRLGVGHRFHDGLRVTDDAALEVAMAVLRGLVNGELVAALHGLGTRAVGLSGLDGGLLKGRRRVELGRVVTRPQADPGVLRALLAEGFLPVTAPLAYDEQGLVCNVNADEAAAALAAALDGILLLLTDNDGVRGADGHRIPELTAEQAEALIEAGVIGGGMVPKVRSAARALGDGGEAVIADGRQPGVLDAAIRGAVGTRIVQPHR